MTPSATRRIGRILSRLTLSEWLTLWVGLASLAVSYLTHRIAADTKELQRAVQSLADLAEQTKRQADISHGEIGLLRQQVRSAAVQADAAQKLIEPAQQSAVASMQLMRNQTENFALEQRPIVVLNNEVPGPARGGPELDDSAKYVRWNFALENIGRSTATDVLIETSISVLEKPLQVEYHSGGELPPGRKQWATARYFLDNNERRYLIEAGATGDEQLLAKITYKDALGRQYSTLSCLVHFANGAYGVCDYAQSRARLRVAPRTDRQSRSSTR